MFKFSATDDWKWDVSPVQLLHHSRTLEKAGAAKDELKVEKTAGQTDLLVIALGSYEGTGANRNGDFFKEAECLEHYKTFVKSGSRRPDGSYDGRALNRHHKNKPTDPKYGNIKAAAYNRNMRRIELVVGLDNEKCAKEIQDVADGKQINVSMAAKVAHDNCTWCGHAAPTENDRCSHIPSMLGEINKQGEMCSMDNVRPRWFELSIVGRPADRIGMSLKLASFEPNKTIMSYRDLYPGFVPPVDDFLVSKHAAEKRKLIHKLSELEKHIDGVLKEGPKSSKDKYQVSEKAKLKNSEGLSDATIEELRKVDPSKILSLLASHGIVLTAEDFMKYLFGAGTQATEVSDKVKPHLPGMFSRLADACDDVVNNEKYDSSSSAGLPQGIMKLVRGLFDDHSMFEQPTHKRIIRVTIMKGEPREKLASSRLESSLPTGAVGTLLEQYAAYKLAALSSMEDQGTLDEDTLLNVLLQDR